MSTWLAILAITLLYTAFTREVMGWVIEHQRRGGGDPSPALRIAGLIALPGLCVSWRAFC